MPPRLLGDSHLSASRERYRLDLEALPDGGAPAVIRLRRWLKTGLRAFGLRCTAAVQLHNDSPPTDSTPIHLEDAHD
jgi:hypothetical protein